MRNTPLTFTRIVSSQSASVVSRTVSREGRTPALLTRMSMRPKRSSVDLDDPPGVGARPRRSPRRRGPRRPPPGSRRRPRRSGPGRRSTQAIRAPSSANRRAIASPRPIAAPVTMATFPCSRGWDIQDSPRAPLAQRWIGRPGKACSRSVSRFSGRGQPSRGSSAARSQTGGHDVRPGGGGRAARGARPRGRGRARAAGRARRAGRRPRRAAGAARPRPPASRRCRSRASGR